MKWFHTVDFMLVRGAGFGVILGGLVGLYFGWFAAFYGVTIGAAAGALSGLVIGVITKWYFSPINNERFYRIVTALIACAVSGMIVLVLWSPLVSDYRGNVFPRKEAMAIASVLGVYGSQIMVEGFLTKKKKKR
jgi:hypothetical protein